MRKKYLILLMLIILGIFFFQESQGEIYKYLDKDGHLRFADDMSNIPEEYLDNVEVYPSRKSKPDREEIFPGSDERADEPEVVDEVSAHLPEKQETKFTLENNRILVPVVLGTNGTKTETVLVLDTGASGILLHRDIADELHITKSFRHKSRVADGRMVDTDFILLGYVTVGPHTKKNLTAGIVDYEGPPAPYKGLLGMNFLKGLDYKIDQTRQVIQWNP